MIMKTEMKILLQRLRLNPIHLILGLVVLSIGIALLVNDDFFYWPPEWQWFFNNDLVDAFAIVIGTGLIAFVFVGGKNQLANALLLSFSAFFLTVLTVLQIGHVLVAHDYSRLLSIIAIIGWILVIQYLTTHSKTVKRRK